MYSFVSKTYVHTTTEWLSGCPDAIYLSSIWAEKGSCGHGTEVLGELTRLCDKFDVSISASVTSFDENISEEKLLKWYLKNGFQLDSTYEGESFEMPEVNYIPLSRQL
ncbi:MAG: hypothetical protein CMH31_00300 [Micavibrio sp.]|nr:hypothetical protein [Micavibrio sp.]|tara:strand:- start:603 stop:926 length:324 start_codon:yes stop_codon:yes gene_type:complete